MDSFSQRLDDLRRYLKTPEFAARKQHAIEVCQSLLRSLEKSFQVDFCPPAASLVPGSGVLDGRHQEVCQLRSNCRLVWQPRLGAGVASALPHGFSGGASTEVLGAIFLLVGFAVRWISLPLIFTMLVAMFKAHWENGWLAIATGSGIFVTDRTAGAIERLGKARELLKQHGDYAWLTANGDFVVLNNGIEFAATYLVMLVVLFFMGGGRWVSVDDWLRRRYMTG